MSGGVDEANAMSGVRQALFATALRLEDAPTPLDPEVQVKPATFGDQPDQRLGHVGIERVDDEHPTGFRVSINRRLDVGDNIVLGARSADGGLADAAGSDVPVGHKAQRAMTDVLELDPFDLPGLRWQSRMLTLESLNARLLVAGHDVSALLFERRGLHVRFTERLYVLAISFGVVALVRRREPIAALVRSEVGFF